jgi:hypothetical protein
MLLPHSDELNLTKCPYLLSKYQAILHETLLLHSRTDSCETVVSMCSARVGWNECTLWKSLLTLSLPFVCTVCFNFGLFRSYTASALKEWKSRIIHFTISIKGNMYDSLQIKIEVLSKLKILLKTCFTVMNI